MKHHSLLHLLLTGAIASLLCLTYSCNSHGHDAHEHEAIHTDEDHGHEDHDHAPGTIILAPDKAKAAGIEVSVAGRGTFHDVIQATGSITAASCDETTIVATMPGIVEHAQHISEGMAITRGTTVYYLASSSLQNGDQAQRTRIAYLAAKREYERALPLVRDNIITAKEFSTIQSEYDNARIAYEAIDSNTTPRGIAVKAPCTGYMKECMVKDGDYVEVGTPLMVITKNQHLYLRAEVPVRYYSQMSSIRSAKFKTQYSGDVYSLSEMNGKLMSSGKSATSTSSYVPVTFQLDNTGNIIPGSYVEVFLITGERQNILSLPTTALTEEQGLYYVYVQNDADSYRKQEVTLGATDGDRTEIVKGLLGGERVVTKGAINVKLAAAANAIPAHTHNH